MNTETSPEHEVAIIGNGIVGKAYQLMFPEAVVYDEPQLIELAKEQGQLQRIAVEAGRSAVNQCELAIVCVPTNPLEDGSLDMSIVEDVVGWCESDVIMIKSALMPGTTDRLKEETGKRIVVSPEYIGEGNYFLPPWLYPDPKDPTKHRFIIVGGDPKDRSEAANRLWNRMSPDIHIHQTSALEAETIKMVENTWGAMKVAFANEVYEICEALGASQEQFVDFIQVIKGWGLDSRTDAMHTRTMQGKRGYRSKCYDKDIPGLIAAAKKAGYDAKLFQQVFDSNEDYLARNEDSK